MEEQPASVTLCKKYMFMFEVELEGILTVFRYFTY
jgi:hypothetical protein